MNHIEYIDLRDLDPSELLRILNKEKVRKHLAPHETFDDASLEEWIVGKVEMDKLKGCKVKGILVNGSVAGWCGIQYENQSYELAIVLDEDFWGMGISVFKEVMLWACNLGHRHVVLHLLNTRPAYRFLRKMASRVYESRIFGQKYTSYELRVPRTCQ